MITFLKKNLLSILIVLLVFLLLGFIFWDNVLQPRSSDDFKFYALRNFYPDSARYLKDRQWYLDNEIQNIELFKAGEFDKFSCSFKIEIIIDTNIKIDSTSILQIGDGIGPSIYDSIFKSEIDIINLNVYSPKSDKYGLGANIDIAITDTLNKRKYLWYSYSRYEIYNCKKITFKLDEYSVFLAKTDKDWFYYGTSGK